MTAKTDAQRKADERKRRRDNGEVLVQVWCKKEAAEAVRVAMTKAKKKHGA